ncbi:MAG TPA: TetR/AcrR family transcriptional regulator [Acidimicrobiales bacterium]|nr:TetR/AcrR family transcriptional regulator [Acidimicrobiales bacterium]
MTRMAAGRTTHLTVDEIVRTALDLFDENTTEFSMRTLAARLKVSPAALYHHFEKQSDLITAVVASVWEEAVAEYMTVVDDPFGVNAADPEALLLAAAVAARRAFDRHPRVAPHIAVPVPTGDSRLAGALAVFGAILERLGLEGEAAGGALYAYSTYVLGSILLSAHRQLNDHAADRPEPPADYSSTAARPADAPPVSDATSAAIDRTVGMVHSEAEEAMFIDGLRSLIRGLVQRDGTLACSSS